jgi:sulfite reductase alpha subunit-like flavoprotein
MADPSQSLLILYGSQTGASKTIAERAYAAAQAASVCCALAPLNDHANTGFASLRYVIIVCSTTGDGDAPNNAEE